MGPRKRHRRAVEVFGENLRKRRLEAGISQEALAEISGLHRTYVGAVERGERNITFDSAECLAGALGLRLVDLLVE